MEMELETRLVMKSESRDSGLCEARVESWVLSLDLNNSKLLKLWIVTVQNRIEQ